MTEGKIDWDKMIEGNPPEPLTDDEYIAELEAKNEKLNTENAKLLAELITAKEEIKQLKIKLKNHEDRIMENARILQ